MRRSYSLICALMLLPSSAVHVTPQAISETRAAQIVAQTSAQAAPQKPIQQSFTAANSLKLTVKEVAPYNQTSDLQILCFFKHKSSGDTVLSAVADLDQKLGGIISSLRSSGQFVGEERETLVFVPPKGSVQPKLVMLVGLGEEQNLSLDTMRRIGTTVLREAVKLKATRVSYASALRDQGNSKLDTGDVAQAVVQNVILAYDTEKRLQQQGLAQPFTIAEWTMEAGADYYKDTATKVQMGINNANTQVAARPATAFRK